MKRKRSRLGSSDSRFRRRSSAVSDAHDGTRKGSWLSNSSRRSSLSVLLDFCLRRRKSHDPASTSSPTLPQRANIGPVLTPNPSDPDLRESTTRETGPILQLSRKKYLNPTDNASLGLHRFHFTSRTNVQSFEEYAKLQKRYLQLREQLQVQQDLLPISLGTIEQSLIQLDGVYEAERSAPGSAGLRNEVRAVLNSIRESRQAVLKHLVQMKDLEQQCQSVENEMLRLHTLQPQDDADEVAGPKDKPTSTPQAGDDAAPLLDQYFSRRGDLLMFRDELTDLEEQYEESISRQQLQQDQDRAPDTWHEDFLRNFDSRRNAVLKNILQAGQDMDELRQACIARGLSLDDLRPRSESSRSSPKVLTSREQPSSNVPRLSDDGHGMSVPSLLAAGNFPSLTQPSRGSSKISLHDPARMENWIDALPSDRSTMNSSSSHAVPSSPASCEIGSNVCHHHSRALTGHH